MSEADLTEQLVSVASQVLSADQLPAYLAVTDAKKFVGDDGDIDAEKVLGPLRRLYGISDTTQRQQSSPNFGQHSGQPAGQQPGDTGRNALKKRHGVGNSDDANHPDASSQLARGAGAKAELAKRYGGRK